MAEDVAPPQVALVRKHVGLHGQRAHHDAGLIQHRIHILDDRRPAALDLALLAAAAPAVQYAHDQRLFLLAEQPARRFVRVERDSGRGHYVAGDQASIRRQQAAQQQVRATHVSRQIHPCFDCAQPLDILSG